MDLAALRRTAIVENVSLDDEVSRTRRPPLRRKQRWLARRSDGHSPNGGPVQRNTHPYREDPEPDRRADSGEEALLYGLLVVIGLIPMLIALATGTRFGGEPSIGTMMVGGGLWGLWRLRGTTRDHVRRRIS